jgi:hypothetical protein|tara:strand:- start:2249 stop:2458 length:210 start_codon:yes stop_codon:yes gene_type:complete
MINLYKLFSFFFVSILLVGCNSQLKNQVTDLEQELAATEVELAETEAELEEEKTADEVWEELAEKNTKK